MQRPPADLGSGHRRERVGGSEDGLVEHHGLGRHHRHAAHLTHLGVDLRGGGVREACLGAQERRCVLGRLDSPFRTQALVVWSWGTPWEAEPVGRGERGDKLSTC